MEIKTPSDAKAYLNSEIEKLEKELPKMKKFSDEEIKANSAISDKLFAAIEAKDTVESKSLYPKLNFAITEHCNAVKKLENLKATLLLDLMIVNTKYLLVPEGSHLVSPAGFHTSSKVFLLIPNSVAVNTLPQSSNMCYFDISKY